LLIWRFLLRLPHNTDAYQQLASRGIHPAYAALAEKYPIKDGRLLKRLQMSVPPVQTESVRER
jgi:hypothetical protein